MPTPLGSTDARLRTVQRQLSYPPFQMLHASAKPTHDFPYPLDLVKLRFQLVNLVEDGAETSDLRICHLYRVARAVVLGLCRGLGGTIELQT